MREILKHAETCVCCGKPLDKAWQESIVPTRDGFWLVTCRTPGCELRTYTFSDTHYPPEQLERYDANGVRK